MKDERSTPPEVVAQYEFLLTAAANNQLVLLSLEDGVYCVAHYQRTDTDDVDLFPIAQLFTPTEALLRFTPK